MPDLHALDIAINRTIHKIKTAQSSASTWVSIVILVVRTPNPILYIMKPRKKRRKKWFIVIGLLIACWVGYSMSREDPEMQKLEVTTKEVERKDLTQVVSGIGKIHPEVVVKISSEVSGEIIELPVIEGQYVRKGDLLLKVNPEKFEVQLRQRKAALRSAEIARSQSKARLTLDELELERLETLLAKKFVAQQEVDRQRTVCEVSRSNYEASSYQIEQAQTGMEEAQESLSLTTVLAPLDGTIIKLTAELGERVVGTGQFAGTEIMRVANLAKMEVRILVSELDIVNVELDDIAKIEIDAFPKDAFQGKVTAIGSSSAQKGDRGDQMTDYQVKIKILDLIPELRPGMTASIDIETKTVENVIVVPLESVTVRDIDDIPESLKEKDEDEEKTEEKKKTLRIVFVFKDAKAEMRVVDTGISDLSHMEIISGLNEDETVITGPYSAVSEDLSHEEEVRTNDGGED